jgi:protein tyrosine phosphatase (PTP) superfamily phosphohydrolase (DUF442 family)
MKSPGLHLLVLLVTTMLAGCGQPSASDTISHKPDRASASAPGSPTEYPGLHNVFRITEQLYSGSSPDGDEGFRSLEQLGIRTIISVDGARPDVERAKQFGLRYAHLPIGYDGVPRDQALKLTKAVRDLPGPVYLHCHHGKHRGPAAVAVVHLCLDKECKVETAIAEMRRAGTDPRYIGLYAAPEELRRPSADELAKVPSDFPEVAPVTALAQIMVDIDGRWDHIKLARTAGWKVPDKHPDIDPPHEALQLTEHFRQMGQLPTVKDLPEEFRRWLAESEQAAADLEKALRSQNKRANAEKAFDRLHSACSQCHAKYRDVPKKP